MLSPMECARQGDNFGGIFDSIKSGLAAVLPSHTIVGKWAQGDTAGAAAAAVNAITPKPPKAVAVPSAGGMQPQPETDNTMLYVGIGTVVLIGLAVFMRRR